MHIFYARVAQQRRTHIVVEENVKYTSRNGCSRGNMRKLYECDMEEFSRLESSEKTIAILEDRWWPQSMKQDGDAISKPFLFNIYIWKKRNERPNVGGVSIWSRNGALRLDRAALSTVK